MPRCFPAANRKEQAVGLYRQVLAGDSKNVTAWVGLIQSEHQLGQEAVAYDALRSMPPSAYTAAMQEAGFESTVAAVYEGEDHDELAQQVLEQFLANQKAQGKQLFVPAEVQLAGIYMRHGDAARAYTLFKSVLQESGADAGAWNGLLGALHATGHDREALAQLQAIPSPVRTELENNPAYLQTVGSIYAGLGDSPQALRFLARVQEHYGTEHVQAPADLEIQEAWLLYNSHSDAALLRGLLALGDRRDLSDRQRLTVQTIWANFATRRAAQVSAAGNPRLALAILNAAARSFPNNPAVRRALAGGYASAGMPKEAVAIFRAEDLNTADAGEYRAAVGAALAANDLRDAETWLRFGLDQYPRDPQMMILAARFEAARGDQNRAAEYYRAALSVMPVANPGSELATELALPAAQAGASLPNRQQSQDLATLLAQPAGTALPRQPLQTVPYLPSFNGGTGAAPTPMNETRGFDARSRGRYGPREVTENPASAGDLSGTADPGSGYFPGAMGGSGGSGSPDMGGFPAIVPNVPSQAHTPGGSGSPMPHSPTLQEYTPQPESPHSRLKPMLHIDPAMLSANGGKAPYLHANPVTEGRFGPYVTYDPARGVPHFVGAVTGLGDGVTVPAHAGEDISTAKVVSALGRNSAGGDALHTARFRLAPVQQGSAPQLAQASSASVPAGSEATPRLDPTGQQAAAPTPVVPYAAVAYPVSKAAARRQATATRSASAEVRARAAAIRENQASATSQMIGVSKPPSEAYDVAPSATLSGAQYTAYDGNSGQAPGQVPQPSAPPGRYSSSAPAAGVQNVPQSQVGDSYGQQYPQPGSAAASAEGKRRKRHSKQTLPESTPAESAPMEPGSTSAQRQPMQYPNAGEPLENMGPPPTGAAYPLGQAPSDYQLQQRNLPPLRAYYDPRADTRRPLTERQTAELGLAQIEGSYSGWAGGSVIGRYRSGTAGVDRLAALEVPFEASFVVSNSFRFSIIPKLVFLNSGTLNTNGGSLGTGPVLGTYLGTATVSPSQQFANGIGGEIQIATNTFSAAVGRRRTSS